MTETDWLTGTRPKAMLRHAQGTASARKLRLVGCAAIRLAWDHLPAEATAGISVVERYLDGLAVGEGEYDDAQNAAVAYFLGGSAGRDRTTPEFAAEAAAASLPHPDAAEGVGRSLEWVVATFTRAAPVGRKHAAMTRARREICDRFREILGNPFRPWKPVPDFLGGGMVQPDGRTVRLTDTARRLADGIWADQAFDRLPILADALEEAGVTDPELLAHCRAGAGHVRGCWALDVVLGKA